MNASSATSACARIPRQAKASSAPGWLAKRVLTSAMTSREMASGSDSARRQDSRADSTESFAVVHIGTPLTAHRFAVL